MSPFSGQENRAQVGDTPSEMSVAARCPESRRENVTTDAGARVLNEKTSANQTLTREVCLLLEPHVTATDGASLCG